jgi:protein-L-isoaspartate(D-aspartate) O-methyltransferase
LLLELGLQLTHLLVQLGELGSSTTLLAIFGIIVTAAAPHVPGPLLQQLAGKDGARIVIPIGSAEEQDLIVYERAGDELREFRLGPVRFVPLVGRYGWQEPER